MFFMIHKFSSIFSTICIAWRYSTLQPHCITNSVSYCSSFFWTYTHSCLLTSPSNLTGLHTGRQLSLSFLILSLIIQPVVLVKGFFLNTLFTVSILLAAGSEYILVSNFYLHIQCFYQRKCIMLFLLAFS